MVVIDSVSISGSAFLRFAQLHVMYCSRVGVMSHHPGWYPVLWIVVYLITSRTRPRDKTAAT